MSIPISWLFVDESANLQLLICQDDRWPREMGTAKKLNLKKDEECVLTINGRASSYVLLASGPKKAVTRIYENKKEEYRRLLVSEQVEIVKRVEPTRVEAFTVGAELKPEDTTKVNVSVFNQICLNCKYVECNVLNCSP